uniref:Secreted protein n=1 Tax=Parascaris univalens TaxID=6257 RepID=A0A914ZY39_PARUN
MKKCSFMKCRGSCEIINFIVVFFSTSLPAAIRMMLFSSAEHAVELVNLVAPKKALICCEMLIRKLLDFCGRYSMRLHLVYGTAVAVYYLTA